MKNIKNIIFNLTKDIFDYYSTKSYSSEGEDVVLKNFLDERNKGFYVDIGAHHPWRFSNTHYFYRKGWRGINIDAMPGGMKLFRKRRSRDINLEVAISDKDNELNYYRFEESALNGFSDELSLERAEKRGYNIVSREKIKTRKLADVLDEHLPEGQKIDFMSIDVEGLDFAVLKSNNWAKYSPNFLIVEILNSNILNIFQNDILIYLTEKGYEPVAKTINSVIFRLKI